MAYPRHLIDPEAHEERFAELRRELREEMEEAVKGISGIPPGCIVMWSGAIATIPTGWALCNGASGTPDLRDRFVVGAGSTYAVKDTGGAETHSHTATIGATTLTVAQMPNHTHSTDVAQAGTVIVGARSPTGNRDASATYTTSATGGGGSHTHTGTVAAASRGLPPYFALAYIMKL